MGSKYRYVPAEGQEDNNSCWAACLVWWLRATNKRRMEQWEVMSEDAYSDLWDNPTSEGTITDQGLLTIVNDNRWEMRSQVIEKGVDLNGAIIKAHLHFGPVYIGYYDDVRGGKHVNVIYDIYGPIDYPRVLLMEPASKRKNNGTFKGKHDDRGLSYYRFGKVILGSPRHKLN